MVLKQLFQNMHLSSVSGQKWLTVPQNWLTGPSLIVCKQTLKSVNTTVLCPQSFAARFSVVRPFLTKSEMFPAKPSKVRYGVLKVVGCLVPSMCLGVGIAFIVATLLQKMEIFIPDEDDDQNYWLSTCENKTALQNQNMLYTNPFSALHNT